MTARYDNSRNSPLQAWVRALAMTAPLARNPTFTLPILIDELAERFENASALIDEEGGLSYRALAERSNRYARWALEHMAGAGSVVCLMMANCPDYLAIWLGITRAGGVVALLNTQLFGDSLAHAIRVVAPNHVIVGVEFAPALAGIRSRLAPEIRYWAHGASHGELPRIDAALEGVSGASLTSAQCPLPLSTDRALYIYTSGTTGRPKAANVSHYRVMQWSHWFAGMLDTRSSDRMYNCLPMYHSIGGVVAVGATLVNGGSVLLRRGFSVRHFWQEIAEFNCTLFQYIGELCRFLLRAAEGAQQPEHQIRLCCGNGLRGDIWEPFKERLRIPAILEFYAATEANFSLYNCEGKPGAIGRIPSFLAHRFPVALVRFDAEAGVPLRNAAGFCERCSTDEVGEAISKIATDALEAGGRFEGYTDKAATDLKVLREVFTAGDAWFRSGDLMRRDAAGFFYFVDRVGDTFRWKGENVSTSEVADVINRCPGVVEAIVYGVTVAGAEGRAGMAALVCDADFDIQHFEQHIAGSLPEYARPVFLRVLNSIGMTATFKPQKQELVRAGFDCSMTADALFVKDKPSGIFLKIDAAMAARIESHEMRL
ncbi:MAG TPA: long-chain-acyl-CoA synthetase [Steroidobacteraceae bacterium]